MWPGTLDVANYNLLSSKSSEIITTLQKRCSSTFYNVTNVARVHSTLCLGWPCIFYSLGLMAKVDSLAKVAWYTLLPS
jgi:hypothetical protein